MIAVARRYAFQAHHHVEALNDPWNQDHWHDYTVEVVAEKQTRAVGQMVVDTDELDAVFNSLRPRLHQADLNTATPTDTTVEALAAWFLDHFPDVVREVTVWEDTWRWGRARR